jgi:hypothetical protein
VKFNVQGSLFALFLGALAALPPISIDMALPALGPIAHTLHVTPGTAQVTLSLFYGRLCAQPNRRVLFEASLLNKRAAIWSAFAAAFGALASVLGST